MHMHHHHPNHTRLIKIQPTHLPASITPQATPPSTDARVATTMPPTALVYAGEGAGSRSVLSAVEALQKATLLHVQTISAEATLRGAWAADARLFVMPGGADLPYCQRLNGIGNGVIRRTMVFRGGSRVINSVVV